MYQGIAGKYSEGGTFMRKKRRFNTLAIILAVMLAFSGVGTAFAEPAGSTAIEEIVSVEGDSAEIVEEEAEAAEEVTVEAAEENTVEAVEEDAAEVTEEDAAEVTEEDAAEAVEEEVTEVAEEDAAEVVEEDAAEVTEEDAAEVAEEDAAEVTEEDAAEVTEEDASESAEIESTEAVEEEPAGGVEEESAEAVEEETTEAVEEETTGAAAEESTEAAAEESTEAAAEESTEAVEEESSVITQMTRLEAPTITLDAYVDIVYGWIYLSWKSVDGADKYIIYRDGSVLSEEGSSAGAYYDGDVVNGVTYSYYISAYDSTGNLICKSSSVSATYRISIDLSTPDVEDYYVSLDFNWADGIDDYQLWRNGIYLSTKSYWLDEYSGGFWDYTLTSSGTYIYEVVGFDKNGNEICKSNPRTVTWTAPEGGIKPLKIQDVGNTTKGVSIYWQPDDRAEDSREQYYEFYRSRQLMNGRTEDRKYISRFDVSPAVTPLDGLISGELYNYEAHAFVYLHRNIYAQDEYDVYGEIAVDSFVKRYIGTTTMKAPTCTAKGLRVSWPKVKGAKKYVIFRSVGAGTPDWKYLTTVTATEDATQVYNSNGAFTPGGWYAFTVRAIGEDNPFNPNDTCYGGQPAGRSVLYRQPVKVTKLQSIQSGVRATFTSVTAGYTYGLYRAKVTGSTVGSYSLVSTVTNASVGRDVWITDKTAENGTQYSYYVRCLSSDKKTPLSSYANTMTITYKKP